MKKICLLFGAFILLISFAKGQIKLDSSYLITQFSKFPKVGDTIKTYFDTIKVVLLVSDTSDVFRKVKGKVELNNSNFISISYPSSIIKEQSGESLDIEVKAIPALAVREHAIIEEQFYDTQFVRFGKRDYGTIIEYLDYFTEKPLKKYLVWDYKVL